MYQTSISSGNTKTSLLQDIALHVCKALCSYPHYAIVGGFPAIQDRSNLIDLSQAIGAVVCGQPVSGRDAENQDKVSFTQVRIDETKANLGGYVTKYSRTHQPLTLHTDSSYMSHPHKLVAFQCIVAAQTGGESIMAPVEDILQRIDSEVLELLRAPIYPFGDKPSPIIFGEPGDEQIRYYRAQIDRALETGALPLSDKHYAAIETLDRVLQQTEQFNQFQLQPGQIVFMDNTKVLHGRTGFSQQSDRLLYRVRLHVPNFEVGSQLKASVNIGENQIQFPPSNQSTSAALNLDTPEKNEEPQELDFNNAEAHLVLAKEMRQLNRVGDELEHYRLASELASDNKIALQAFSAYGKLALRMGKFAQATKAFRRCLEIDPQNYDCGLALSSLVHESGNAAAAGGILEQVTQHHPFVFLDKPNSQKPTILRTRGLEGSAYAIVKENDGTYTNLLRGGHFSIKNLVNKQRYNLIILNIFQKNTDQLKDIPNFDLFLNTIACPDLKRESLLAAARLVDRYPHIPVINHPRRVLETTRERNSLRLNMIPGVCFPKTEKLWWDGISLDAIAKDIIGLGFVFPMIIRQVGTQTGSSVALVKSEQALREHFQKSPANKEYYIIQFHDCRKFENVYNKTRVFFIDHNFYPVAHLFNDSWNIHSGDRYSLMNKAPWTQYEEKSFLNDPLSYLGRENFNKLCKIRDLIGLDFFGIDFTILPDGRLFIFELNAAMRHNFDHAQNFPYTQPHLKRISEAFDTMVQRRLKVSKERAVR
ncbi:MAG: TauD/TfdA family dioxygenase [Nostocaceae cyanobacterium]|nr:TauD/TfdA family dioxygenase [Nostocaceae cyanobacterium]